MASVGDVTVRIKAIDEASPVIRRVMRQVWWMQHAGTVIAVGLALISVLVFAVGFLIGAAWS